MAGKSYKKIVLAYSGGLDTSVILAWLKETYDAELIAFCADIGQGEELSGLDKKAKKTGASKCYIEDLTEEFARDFIFPMIQAGAIYENQYFLGTSIARPLIAKGMMEVVRKEKADAISHGATGKGNDQVRFECTAYSMDPNIKIIVPWREEKFRKQFPGRAEMIAYCHKKGIPVQATAKKPYSSDRNLLHISFESGILEDPWLEPSKDMFKLSVAPEDAPDKAEYVTLDFESGICVAVNGKQLSPANVLRTLNKLGGKHGVGRVDLVENRVVGMKSRGVYETPALGAPPDGDADHGPRGHAPARLAHPALQRARLLRLLVLAGAACIAGACNREPEECHRHGSPEALQRQHHDRRTQEPIVALPPRHRDDGERREHLRPERRHRLHQDQRSPSASGGDGGETGQEEREEEIAALILTLSPAEGEGSKERCPSAEGPGC
jgi:argininosuccinate synthase